MKLTKKQINAWRLLIPLCGSMTDNEIQNLKDQIVKRLKDRGSEKTHD